MREHALKELDRIKEQEKNLVFNEFNNEIAWIIGNMLFETAKKEEKSITICVSLHGQRVFYYSFAGTAPTNDDWVRRKENMVYKFFKSSYEMAQVAKLEENDFMKFYGLDTMEFVAAGGSFPIRVKKAGVIGAITVSGMLDNEDHDFVIRIVDKYLENEAKYL